MVIMVIVFWCVQHTSAPKVVSAKHTVSKAPVSVIRSVIHVDPFAQGPNKFGYTKVETSTIQAIEPRNKTFLILWS